MKGILEGNLNQTILIKINKSKRQADKSIIEPGK
jgi:hypothetical protein